MVVGQGPNWGCSAKGKKVTFVIHTASLTVIRKKKHVKINGEINMSKKLVSGTARWRPLSKTIYVQMNSKIVSLKSEKGNYMQTRDFRFILSQRNDSGS
jgi:hypothetical protein